jgi:hypothetical protein
VSHRFGVEESLRRTAEAYEAVRMKRVGKILDVAKHGGQSKKMQCWWQEKIRDWFLWLFCECRFLIGEQTLIARRQTSRVP